MGMDSMALTEGFIHGVAGVTCWGIVTTDAQLKITGWNRWLEVNSGTPASAVVGRHLLDVFSELRTRRLERYYRQALSGQMVMLAQRLHGYLLPLPPSAAGTELPLMQQSARIAPLVEEGRVIGTVTVIEDVTERVVHETALQARAREQTAVAMLSQRALVGGDLDTLLRETTSTLADVLGVESCQVLGLLPDDQGLVARAAAGWNEEQAGAGAVRVPLDSLAGYTLQSGGPIIVEDLASEGRFPVAPGLREHGVVSAACVPILSGKRPFGVLVVYQKAPRAITEEDLRVLQAVANMLGFAVERGHLEHELRRRADDLAEEARRKDEFLAMLAHELRNPLAPMHNAVQIIRSSCGSNRTVEQAGDIVDRQVQHMVRLVDDLLDMSRISQGKVQLRKERIDLASVVVRAVESARPLIDSRKHELTLSVVPTPVWLEGDPTRLVQIVGNLLNNAAKYTDAGGQVWLTAAREGDEAVVRVRDNGIGIRAELLPRIFDLFVQSDRTLDRSEGGLGIGLTLVRSLVELHGGQVTVSSDGPGQGSEFVVRLPALPVSATTLQPDLPADAAHPIPPSARRRILIVDDNVDSAVSLALLLRLKLHDVRVAHDGRAALQEARSYRPEIIFLDIGLPGMDGYEVARGLRQGNGEERMVLVAMTGYGQDEDRRRSQEAGFDGHLVKPVDLTVLEELLKRGSPVAWFPAEQ